MNMNKYINRSSCFLVVCCRIGTEYIENHMPARCAFFRTRTESESLTIVHWRCLLRMEISSWNTEMTSVGFGGSVCRHHHRRPRDTTDDRWSLRWGSDPKGSIPLDLVEVSWKGWLVSDGIVWSKSLSSRCRDYDILYIYMYIYTHILYTSTYVHCVRHAVGLCWVLLRPPGAWPKEYGETSIAFGERDEIDSKLQRSL